MLRILEQIEPWSQSLRGIDTSRPEVGTMRLLLACSACVFLVDIGPSWAAPPAATVRVRVHVQDLLGKPIAEGRAVLFKTTPQTGRALLRDANLVIGKQGEPNLGSRDGVIETPPVSNRQAYVLEVEADGFAPELTRWTPANQSGTIDIPPVRLRRCVEIRGLVINRRGQPIPNAVVVQSGDGPKRLETHSDQGGQFVLQGVPEGRAAVCFEASGFRYFGTVLQSPSEGARIELERVDESNPRTLKRDAQLPTQLSQEQRSAAARQLIDPIISAVLTKKIIDDQDSWKLIIAARLEPKQILSRINDLKFSRPFRQEQIRNIAQSALYKDRKPDELMQEVAKLGNPQMRINSYLYWFQNNPQIRANRGARRDALNKAAVLIAATKDVRSRVFWLCELGSQLCAIGDHAEAHKVFDECRTLLKTMPDGAQGKQGVRFTLAMAVARENTKEATELAGDLEPGQMIRLAGEVARERPEEVEALLAPVRSEASLMQLSAVGNNLPGLCYRLARRDPAAAERILLKFAKPPQAQSDAESVFGLAGSMFGGFSKELIDFQVQKVKVVCFGLIADAVAKRNPAAARHAILEAVEIVRPMRTGFLHPLNQFYHTPSGLMMSLVPVAERVDRALAKELFWRALSLRVPMLGESAERMALDIDDANLADIVMFYDRSLAADLLEPLLSRVVSRSYSGMRTSVWPIRSLASLDPERAIKFADSLCNRAGWDGAIPRESAIQAIANVLATAPAQDADDGRMKSALSGIRNSYGVYLDTEDDAS
jgi:Carboxypeptidase regulatory-like domain